MGIKLDWEIEAEQSHVRNTGEDKESVRQRRQARLRLILIVVGVVVLFVAIAAGVLLRLQQVDYDIEQRLRNTVDAEVAALRIGDRSAFLANQRSATNDWLLAQEQIFEQYQTLKIDHDVRLTGHVIGLLIDDERARVEVEEIIDGVPYKRVWFYWKYEEGWRHVPPDYTFWGDTQTATNGSVSVQYHALDSALGQAMSEAVGAWVSEGCQILGCANLPAITVEIVPDDSLQTSWSASNPWLLQVPSPAASYARVDVPFAPELRQQVASLISERLVAQTSNNVQPVLPADAVYLRQAVVNWLADRFAQSQSDAYLVDSLAANYGEPSIARLLQSLQPASEISLLAQITGAASIDQAPLDWRDFLTWRLNLENELIAARDEASFLTLYDVGDESARTIASGRFAANISSVPFTVVSVTPQVDANGVPHLYARAQSGNEVSLQEVEVIFRLVNGVWRRVN